MESKNSDMLVLSYSKDPKDEADAVLIVGRKNGNVDIVNAFTGAEATELYLKLAGGSGND